MDKSILLELHYLGSLPYYSKLLLYPQVWIEQKENYRKGSFRNRCYIATANGVLPLSIPLLKGKHQQASITEVAIDNHSNWQQQHWRSIKTAYGNSPFFDYYAADLIQLYQQPYHSLFDFCWAAQVLLLELLTMAPSIALTTSYETTPPEAVIDFRHQLLPKNYVDYQDSDYFPLPYPQVFEDRQGFLPNLSILDLLFCTGPEAPALLMQCIKASRR
ncbi:MAG: WbqC family protein [Aureispira sp.]